MRIAWYSNSPTAPTGYGAQTKQVTKRLRDAGHEVHIIANYGQSSGNGIQMFDGIPVWPQGVTQYSTDVLDATVAAIKPDYVVTLFDVWPLRGVKFAGVPTVSWTPVDHDPVPPEVIEFFAQAPRPAIAMSEFGKRCLADVGVESVYIPHAIEDTFQPRDPDAMRAELQVPGDAYVVGIVAANIGSHPPRKMWVENLGAVAQLMRAHEDVYLYLHTDLKRPNGINLEYWVQFVGIDPKRVRTVDPLSYRVGTTTEEQMSHLYSAMDVLLACSGGEGFGIPVVEAMRCGTPAIVTDFSAQPEIVGDTGWRVGYQLLADYGQGSWLATPRVNEIVDALEASYAERGTPAAEARALAARQRAEDRYDADRVFGGKWLPLLSKMEAARNRATAEAHGLTLPANAGQLVDPNGQPLNRAERRAQRRNKR